MRTEELVAVSDSIKYIDYTQEEFIQENVLIMNITHGGVGYTECCSMPFDIHQKYVKESVRLQNEINNKMEDLNEDTYNG